MGVISDHREQAIRDVAAALGRSPGRLSYAVKNGGLGVKAKELAYAVDTTEKLLAAEARVLELEAQSVTAAAKELELGAQWLRHEGFDSAADSLLLIRPGEITEEDRAHWFCERFRVINTPAQLPQKEGERG